MPPISFIAAIALAGIAVALIIARYRSEQRLHQSFQDLRRSQERRQLAQDRLDRSLDALGDFIKVAKDELAQQDAAAPPTISDRANGKSGQGTSFCSNCNSAQLRPSHPALRQAMAMGAGPALARRSKVQYYARRSRRLRSASVRAQAIRRLV